jgi:hypothetical protein
MVVARAAAMAAAMAEVRGSAMAEVRAAAMAAAMAAANAEVGGGGDGGGEGCGGDGVEARARAAAAAMAVAKAEARQRGPTEGSNLRLHLSREASDQAAHQDGVRWNKSALCKSRARARRRAKGMEHAPFSSTMPEIEDDAVRRDGHLKRPSREIASLPCPLLDEPGSRGPCCGNPFRQPMSRTSASTSRP